LGHRPSGPAQRSRPRWCPFVPIRGAVACRSPASAASSPLRRSRCSLAWKGAAPPWLLLLDKGRSDPEPIAARADDRISSRASLRTAPAATTASIRECKSAPNHRMAALLLSAYSWNCVRAGGPAPEAGPPPILSMRGAGGVGENSQEVLVEHFGRRGRDEIVSAGLVLPLAPWPTTRQPP
jgi:hypothetical protein